MMRPRPSAILFDIDGTITGDLDPTAPQIGPGHILDNAIFDVIAGVMRNVNGLAEDEAARRIREVADKTVFWDYPDFISELGLPSRETWGRLRLWHRENLTVYQDAVQLVRRLHSVSGLALAVISNNPVTGCLLKLERAALGTLRGAPCFTHILGSNLLRGQKHDPAYWRRGLDALGHDPRQVWVVGDSPSEDGNIPVRLGVGHVWLVDRAGLYTRHPSRNATIVRSLAEFPKL
jgi:FMN phosphatase YigB (HAD superfamily)